MKQLDRRLRIIGGNWRGRKVSFTESDDLRPTASRVRETLFNWLVHDIHGASCLELFAGSGILSLEALSRGASHVTMIEQSPAVVKSIQQSFRELDADPDTYAIIKDDANAWLANCERQYDIVFMDPPFGQADISALTKQLQDRQIARQLVYIESGSQVSPDQLPAGWEVHRQKKAGAVHYCLCNIG